MRWASVQDDPALVWLHHIANGGQRNPRTAALLKAQGVKPGILDLHLPVPRGPFHGMMIELKKPGEKPVPSTDQASYMEFLTENSYCTYCLSDFEAIKAVITAYLALPAPHPAPH